MVLAQTHEPDTPDTGYRSSRVMSNESISATEQKVIATQQLSPSNQQNQTNPSTSGAQIKCNCNELPIRTIENGKISIEIKHSPSCLTKNTTKLWDLPASIASEIKCPNLSLSSTSSKQSTSTNETANTVTNIKISTLSNVLYPQNRIYAGRDSPNNQLESENLVKEQLRPIAEKPQFFLEQPTNTVCQRSDSPNNQLESENLVKEQLPPIAEKPQLFLEQPTDAVRQRSNSESSDCLSLTTSDW